MDEKQTLQLARVALQKGDVAPDRNNLPQQITPQSRAVNIEGVVNIVREDERVRFCIPSGL